MPVSGVLRWFSSLFGRLFPQLANSPAPTVAVAEQKAASNMTATISERALQMVRPHIRSIRFPKNRTANIVASPSASEPVHAQSPSSSAKQEKSKIGLTPRGSGIEEKDLPRVFRRKPIDSDEINAINMGGRY